MFELLLGLWLFILLAALGACLFDLFNLPGIPSSIRFFFSVSLGMAWTAFFIFSLGQVNLLYPLLIISLNMGLTLVLIKVNFSKLLSLSHSINYRNLVSGNKLELFLKGLFLVLVIVLIGGALTPELRQDSLQYHVTVPHQYLMEHRMWDIPYLAYHFYSLNMEMIYTLAMAVGGTPVAKLIHAGLALLTALLIYIIVRREVPGKPLLPIMTALLYYSLPQAGWMSATTYNENVWMFFGVVALAAWLEWRKSFDYRYLYLVGFVSGMGMTFKMIVFAFYPFVLGLFTLVVILRNKRKEQWIHLGIYSILLWIPLIPWFIRNYLYTRNPVFPLFSNLFKSYPDYAYAGESFRAIRSLPNFHPLALLDKFNTVFQGILMNGNYMVALFGICFIFGLLLWKSLPRTIKTIGIYGILIWVIYNLLEGGLDGRFIYPTYPIMAIFAGYILLDIIEQIQSLSTQKIIISLIGIGLIGFSIFGRMGYMQDLNESWTPVLNPPEVNSYLTPRLPYYSVFHFINQHLPSDSYILLPANYSGVYCERRYLANSEFDLSPLRKAILEPKTTDEIIQRLRDYGVTHVVIENMYIHSLSRDNPIQDFLTHHTRTLYSSSASNLYQILP